MADRDDAGEGRAGGLTRGERNLLGALSGYLGFADFVAVMMVISTALSAFATWRTATIADAIYRASERPYIGVEKVYFESSQPSDPKIVVDFRNFGNVPADDVEIGERVSVDGRSLTDGAFSRNAGVISPGVPHQVRVRVTEAERQAVMAGRAQLAVEVRATYRDAALRVHCYLERFVYYPDSDHFDASGGSARCDEQQG